jgi:hypothetical protein
MKNAVLSSVAFIASTLRGESSLTAADLLLASGYLDSRDSVTAETLRTWFVENPRHVLAWALFSVHPKCDSPTALIMAKASNPWRLATVEADGTIAHVESYASGAEACATFVKGYLEDLATAVQHAGSLGVAAVVAP